MRTGTCIRVSPHFHHICQTRNYHCPCSFWIARCIRGGGVSLPAGLQLLIGCLQHLEIIEPHSRQCHYEFKQHISGLHLQSIPAHSDPVTSVQFSGDGTLMLSSSFDGLVRLWDVENGKCLRTIIDSSNPPVALARFSPNDAYILTSSLDSRMRLWRFSDQQLVKTYQSKGFSPSKGLPCFLKNRKGKKMLRCSCNSCCLTGKTA